MKKIFFIMSVLLTAYSLQLTAQTYDSVASFTSKTTIGTTDIIPFQTKVSNKFFWRRMIGSNLWNQITDTTEARITALLNASNSWNGINNFDGATFNAGSHGGVTVNDSLFMGTGAFIYSKFIEPGTAGGRIGSTSKYYTAMYSQNFVVVNSGGTDSAYISYENNRISFDGSLEADTLVGLSTVSHTNVEYQVLGATDSTVTLDYTNAVLFLLPTDITNLETIIMNDIPAGSVHILYLKVADADPPYTLVLKDRDTAGSTDGNLELSGDFTLTIEDTIVLMWVDGESAWFQLSESNN